MANYKVLDESMLAGVIEAASASILKRERINFHPSDDSLVQEMIICAFPNSRIEIHGHHNKSESFCVLKGDLDIFLFETNQPILIERISLRPIVGSCYYRLDSDNPHLVVPRSEPTIFLEITSGPFVRGASSYSPSWASEFNVQRFLTEYYYDD